MKRGNRKVDVFCTCVIKCNEMTMNHHPTKYFAGKEVRVVRVDDKKNIIYFKPLKGGEEYAIKSEHTRDFTAKQPMVV